MAVVGALLGAGVATGAGAGSAGAGPDRPQASASASNSVEAKDPRDTPASPLDIRHTSFGVGPDRRLRGVVTMYSAWRNAALLAHNGGPPGSVCLRLWTAGSPSTDAANYLVCATVRADGRTLSATVLRNHNGGLPVRAATAIVVRSTVHSIIIRFAQSSIGTPVSVLFEAETTAPGCLSGSCVDTAPDAPTFLRLAVKTRPTAKASAARG